MPSNTLRKRVERRGSSPATVEEREERDAAGTGEELMWLKREVRRAVLRRGEGEEAQAEERGGGGDGAEACWWLLLPSRRAVDPSE